MAGAADSIAEYAARGREAFERDPALRDAILYQIVVLGEAAKAALAADSTLEGVLPDNRPGGCLGNGGRRRPGASTRAHGGGPIPAGIGTRKGSPSDLTSNRPAPIRHTR